MKYKTFQQQRNKFYESIFTDTTIHAQQRSLEEDIKYINAAISEINTKKHLTTIRWDRDIMNTSIRKKQTGKGVIRRNLKFTYAHMYDGLHPDDYLRDKWFKTLPVYHQ